MNTRRPIVIAAAALCLVAAGVEAKPPRDRLGRPTFGRKQRVELAKRRDAKPLLSAFVSLFRPADTLPQ